MLGSLLDTQEDIKRRKVLAMDAIKTQKKAFTSKKLSVKTKSKLFTSYIDSIFLYNSEIWTINKTTEGKIDSFQRRLLRRYVLNISWPKIIKNDDVYTRTQQLPWSCKIKSRRLNWFGHLMRLDDRTPAKRAYEYVKKPKQRGPGRPPLNWTTMMNTQLENLSAQIAQSVACPSLIRDQ